MSTSIGAGGGAGNDSDGPKVSRVHVESHPVAKPEPTVTWPVKDGDILLGTVRLSKGVHECVLPDGSVVETFKTLKFALEFLHERGRPIPPEEQATRLKADVDALSQQSPTGQMFWVPDYAKRYGIEESKLQQMIAAEVEAAEKKKRVDAAEQRRREDREEKQRTLEQREREHEAEKKQRLERQERKEADQKAEKKERERQKALAGIAKLPRAEHEAKLQQLARRLDEDVDALREELELLLVDAETAKVREAAERWFESVDANELLHATEAQLRAYLVIHDPAAAAIYTLAVPIAWAHEESATFSPIVGVQGADSEAGKSLLCDVHSLLTPRAHVIVKPTGASLYRLVDYHRPTLYVDNADRLLAGDRDLADIVNSSWTRGHLIPRTVKGIVYEFNPFCFKFINGIDLLPHLEPATRTRCITTEMLKKLPGEKVTHFKYAASDELFSILRRKWLRFSIDNAALIKSADPVMPEGF